VAAVVIDPADTSRCPMGFLCESCGRRGDLGVYPCDFGPLGVGCVTLCRSCRVFQMEHPPPVSLRTASRLVEEHALHLLRFAKWAPK
jgi:hypothetical protein